jgi:ABC-type amino acid transport system permease subunit
MTDACFYAPWQTRLLEITALPAFVSTLGITESLGKAGMNQIKTFMIFAPLLIFAWYYFVAWALGRALSRWRHRQSLIHL